MPALLTQTSTRPKRSSVVATSRAGPSSSVTSHANGWIPGFARGELLEPIDPARGGHDLRARVGQHGGEARAEAARGAGDDRHPAVERESRFGHGQTFMK